MVASEIHEQYLQIECTHQEMQFERPEMKLINILSDHWSNLLEFDNFLYYMINDFQWVELHQFDLLIACEQIELTQFDPLKIMGLPSLPDRAMQHKVWTEQFQVTVASRSAVWGRDV